MRIAINIEGQFKPMTGIQHYVDSLLNALYALDTEHQFTAFAPIVLSKYAMEKIMGDGSFAWYHHPNARIDMPGTDFSAKNQPWAKANSVSWKIANVLDGRVIDKPRGRFSRWQIDTASSRYDLMHLPDPQRSEMLEYRVNRSVATIYDVTTITQPHTHIAAVIRGWGLFFEYAKVRCSRVLTVSEFSKADIVAHLGIPADRIDVTPLAPRASTRRVTDPAELADALGGLGLADAPFVLYCGSLEPRKNLMRLVEAFALAVEGGGLPAHKLVLAGGAWGSHGEELRARAAALGVGERLVTPGYVTNAQMNALMSSCAAFAYVSEYEGFGLPPLEAMLCGAPVVSSNTTSLPEVVGEAGLQVDPVDVEAMAGALRLLLTDGEENARRRVLSLSRACEFSWERTARLTLQSYERAAAQ